MNESSFETYALRILAHFPQIIGGTLKETTEIYSNLRIVLLRTHCM